MTKHFCDRCKIELNVWVPDVPERAKGAYKVDHARVRAVMSANGHFQDARAFDLCDECKRTFFDRWNKFVNEAN